MSRFSAICLAVSLIIAIFAQNIDSMRKEECVAALKKHMDVLKNEYGIVSMSLFGSTARGQQSSNSDIDLFVDTKTPNPFLLMDAKEFLENTTYPSVPWKNVKGLRNIIAHHYFDVDADQILWIVKNEVRPLKDAIRFFNKELSGE